MTGRAIGGMIRERMSQMVALPADVKLTWSAKVDSGDALVTASRCGRWPRFHSRSKRCS